MFTFRLIAGTVLIILCMAPALAPGQTKYAIIDYGTLGGSSVGVTALNNAGEIAGNSATPASASGHAYIVRDGTMLDLGTLGGDYSASLGLNQAGHVTGFSYTAGVVHSRAFLWNGGLMRDLGTLGGDNSEGYRINDYDNVVCVGEDALGVRKPCLWSGDTMTALNIPNLNTIKGFNNHGTIAGNRVVFDSIPLSMHGFVMQNGSITDIPVLPGDRGSECVAMNDSDAVIGVVLTVTSLTRSYLWDHGVRTNIVNGFGGTYSIAKAINNNRDVIGLADDAQHVAHQFLWSNGVMTDLAPLIDTSSGWKIISLNAINDRGQIAGVGQRNGKLSCILLTRPPLVVLNPGQGDRWVSGDQDTIRWAGGSHDSLLIEFSVDDGIHYGFITGGFVPTDSQKFVWTVPDSLSATCRIRLRSSTHDVVESQRFRVKPCVLTRYAPDGSYEAYSPEDHGWAFANGDGVIYSSPPDRTNAVMWPQSWWSQFDYQTATDPYRQLQYPEAFQGGGIPLQADDFIDWPLFVETFGVGACYMDAGHQTYNPTSVLFWKLNKDKWHGSCAGFAISSLLAFDAPAAFRGTFPGVGPFTVLSELPLNDDRRKVINQLCFAGFGRDHYRIVSQNSSRTPKETLEDIRQMLLSESRDDRCLYIRDSATGKAHSLVPYRIKRDGQTSSWQVSVYDCNNNLNNDITIVIDTLTNSWTMPNEQWGGHDHCFLLDPVSTYLQTPAMATPPSNTRAVEAKKRVPLDVMTVYSPRGARATLEIPGHGSIGYRDSLPFNSIPGAEPIIPITATSESPLGYILPVENYSMTLSGFNDSSSTMAVMTDSSVFAISRSDADSAQTDHITISDGIRLATHDAVTKRVNFRNIIRRADNQKVFDIMNVSMSGGDSAAIRETGRTDVTIENYGSPKVYNLAVELVSADGEKLFSHLAITLDSNCSHRLAPEWNSLQSVRILVDKGKDGSVDDSLTLENQAASVPVATTGGVPQEYLLKQNYPNPFNPGTRIEFSIVTAGFVSLTIHDILGRTVATLANRMMPPGNYSTMWDAGALPGGVYFYRLRAGGFTAIKKMMLLR
jgi:probable HAF family extracellular repeat protein